MKRLFEVDTTPDIERAYLVGVSLPDSPVARAHEHLDELERLVRTAGAQVVGRAVQARTRIDGATYIGEGKARSLRETLEARDATLLVFDNDLSPAQARSLEKIIGVYIVDRTELILDIFARHARTQQACIQVELAQLQYALPRLTRLWDHLSRQTGGIGLRGPGETQLEVDRRRIHQRMASLRRRLVRIERRRETLRRGRAGHMTAALIGYTNAGKSSLMQRLTGAEVLVRDRLFATLDTTTRIIPEFVPLANGDDEEGARGDPLARGLPGENQGNGEERYGRLSGNTRLRRERSHGDILLIDTVGFIRKLPDHLITSFRATLADTAQAQLYLHVVDVSHAAFEEQMHVADKAVATIPNPGAHTLYVFNKLDQSDPGIVASLREKFPRALFVSAKTGEGIDDLLTSIHQFFERRSMRVEIRVDAGDGRTIANVRELLHSADRAFEEDVCIMTGHVDSANMGRLENLAGAHVRLLF